MTHSDPLLELAALVADTAPDELDCDAVLDRLAAYLERVDQGNLPAELAAVDQHLRVCPDCYEEYRTLLSVYGEL